MITLSLLRTKSLRKYGDFLKWKIRSAFQPLSGESFFPLEIKADKGSPNDDLKKRESELKPLIQKSKPNCAHGYTLVFEEVKTRANGTQSRLSKILFENEKDFLFFIGKEKESEGAVKALEILKNDLLHIAKSGEEFFLLDWALHNIPALTGEHAEYANERNFWKDIALCVKWLSENRESNLYIREIPLPVHTKFIETNKSLILSLVFPTDTPAVSQFESSLGLKQKPPLVRFRSLDKENPLTAGNFPLSELAIPLEDFENAGNSPLFSNIKKIFIIENEMVYLTFPPAKNAICIWGHGFSVTLLKNCQWLKNHGLFYFGDLDEHGFLILSDFRNHFPEAKSFCMTKEIFEKYENFAVEGKKLEGNQIPKNLTDEEKSAFEKLRENPKKNRLEQERISPADIKTHL